MRQLAILPARRTPDPAFEAFWSAYPKRRPNPKAAARVVFARLCAAGEDPAELAASAGRYAVECRAEKIDPTFIPHARTWLQQRRFEDYLDGAGDPTSGVGDPAAPQAPVPHPLRHLFTEISDGDFAAWIEPLRIERRADEVVVTCPNLFHRDWIRNHHLDLLARAFGTRRLVFTLADSPRANTATPPEDRR